MYEIAFLFLLSFSIWGESDELFVRSNHTQSGRPARNFSEQKRVLYIYIYMYVCMYVANSRKEEVIFFYFFLNICLEWKYFLNYQRAVW